MRDDHPAISEMRCLNRDCLFDTDDVIDAEAALSDKLQLLGLHVQAEHNPALAQPTPAPLAQPATQRRKPEKFPRPTVGVDETREGSDSF